MVQIGDALAHKVDMREQKHDLDNAEFIRARMFEGNKSSLECYKDLTLGSSSSLAKLLWYEFLITFASPVRGSLGLLLRKTFYRSLFANVGRNVVFGSHMTIRHPQKIHVGDGVVLDDQTLIDARGAGDDGIVIADQVLVHRGCEVKAKAGPIKIGSRSSLGSGSLLVSQGGLDVGEDVNIAAGCLISGGLDRAQLKIPGNLERFTGGQIRIGDRAHLAMGVIVLDGVTIGEDAIVQSGSVVMSDVPKGTVVSGFPAREWRTRTPLARESAASPSPAAAEIMGTVRDYLLENYLIDSNESLADEDSFLETGFLDSTSIVAMITWMEEKFAISIGDQEIRPENLDSLIKLAVFVSNKQAS